MIGLKAPGNYSDQFWSNKNSVLLLGRQKTPNSMISGFLGLVETLIYGFNVFKYLIDILKYLIPMIHNRIIHHLIDYSWFMAHGSREPGQAPLRHEP